MDEISIIRSAFPGVSTKVNLSQPSIVDLITSRGTPLPCVRVIRRAAVIDLDVHQGDGTAEIFQGDPDVFTLSIHGESNFPFRKKKSRLDVPLADGVEDDGYLRRLDEVLPAAFGFHPDIVFYQSGVDPLASDVLGRLSLTHGGLIARDRMVFTAALNFGAPFVLTSGGGYSRPIERSAEAHANTFRTAWQMFARVW